jgi:radical SAM protein with 4Fe4S-binding SPASM domain
MKEMKQEILTPKDLFKLHEFLLKVRQDDLIELHTGDNIGYNTAEDEIMRGYKWSGCQAGISVVSIEADGNVKGCLCQLPELIKDKKFVEGNINTRSIKDLWYDDRLFGYSRKFDFSQVDGFCKSCRYLERCKCGCTAFAYYATGTKYSNPYCLYALMSTE